MNEATMCCFLSPREQVLISDLSPVNTAPAVVCFSQKTVFWECWQHFIRLCLCSTDLQVLPYREHVWVYGPHSELQLHMQRAGSQEGTGEVRKFLPACVPIAAFLGAREGSWKD